MAGDTITEDELRKWERLCAEGAPKDLVEVDGTDERGRPMFVLDSPQLRMVASLPRLLAEARRCRSERLAHAPLSVCDGTCGSSPGAGCAASDRYREAVGYRAERDALAARRDELLALVAKLSRETPYEEEAAESRRQVGILLVEVGTLRARVTELAREARGAKEARTERDAARAEAERLREAHRVAGLLSRDVQAAEDARSSAAAAEAERLRAALAELGPREHGLASDGYRCPQLDLRLIDPCTCGASEHNARVKAALEGGR